MERRKLTKTDIDRVRGIAGFPEGTDEDIIALSDAPFYTACPNPFIEEFIRENGTPYDEETDKYQCEPFAADVSEGKNDPIYNAHSYHTKVPYRAIMRYILHYTKPGDVVFDGFCGSGMTGVAAQMCGSPDDAFRLQLEQEMGKNSIQWGARYAVLSDLSPAATFIAANYNTPVDPVAFEEEARRVLDECERELGWMYETRHPQQENSLFGSQEMGKINYTVWSDVFLCPHCGEEIVFWDAAVDQENGKVRDEFVCPNCGSKLKKRDCSRSQETSYDDLLGKVVTMSKQVPVLISYTWEGKRYEKRPDADDLALIEKINNTPIPYWVPTDRMCEGSESRRNDKYGITHVHQFFTRRNLMILGKLWQSSKFLHIPVQSMSVIRLSRMTRYLHGKGGNCNLSGTLYVGSLIAEANVFNGVRGKIADFSRAYSMTRHFEGSAINVGSTTNLPNIPSNSIDYIFTDPPFGANINYSELSFIWEAWLKVKTNNKTEAIINDVQGKGLAEYQSLMTDCFREYYRVLKPNHWMTVEFHNSKNNVWNAIQEALQRAGFVIADVRTLDKKQGSFKQVTTSSAVKQDLVISAYKPKESFTRAFRASIGTEETAWAFVRQHLSNVPVAVDADRDGKLDRIAERQAYLLFDRMVAYHITRGLPVPLDAAAFYRGLDEKFLRRDDMYFLPDQVNEYDAARLHADVEDVQLAFAVTDEKSAISWLYDQLGTPRTYAELQPKFMREVKAVDRREKMPELLEMLEENFLKDDSGKWYVPDLTKSGDLAKLREKNLLKEFRGYQESKGKLKVFRSEAIRVGFAKLWKDKDYPAIVALAERLPEDAIRQDANLLMYYDISLSRV